MKVRRFIGILLAAGGLQGVFAQANLDTLWLCRDSIEDGSPSQLWFRMYLADTFPDNRDKFNMVDTGNSQDGSQYVNFDYQFGNPHPGYAGFKFYWDDGFVKFYADQHDSMVLWHKGPLPGHLVRMIWAQGGECGGPINYQYFGEFKSSEVWKRESFPFPEKRNYGAFPDSPFVKKGLFELRMLIYDDSSVTTSPTSATGCLKLDNICFIKKTPTIVVRPSMAVPGDAGGVNFFLPGVSGSVILTIFSLQGEQLFKGSVNVTAGRKYDTRRFAQNNSHLPAHWIQCVQVSGSGVNVTAKVIR